MIRVRYLGATDYKPARYSVCGLYCYKRVIYSKSFLEYGATLPDNCHPEDMMKAALAIYLKEALDHCRGAGIRHPPRCTYEGSWVRGCFGDGPSREYYWTWTPADIDLHLETVYRLKPYGSQA